MERRKIPEIDQTTAWQITTAHYCKTWGNCVLAGLPRLLRNCSNITATNNGKETAEHTQLDSEVVQKVMSPTGSPTGVIEPQ